MGKDFHHFCLGRGAVPVVGWEPVRSWPVGGSSALGKDLQSGLGEPVRPDRDREQFGPRGGSSALGKEFDPGREWGGNNSGR